MNPTSNTPERWLPVPEYEGYYEVSDHGRVRSVDRPVLARYGLMRPHKGRVLKATLGLRPYYHVSLSKKNVIETHRVHRLVCRAFHGEPPFAEAVIRHLNGNSKDNRPENLAWGTVQENTLDSVAHGVHPNAQKTHCPQGHEYAPENIISEKGGRSRKCRTCKQARDRKRYAKSQAQRKEMDAR